MIVRFCVLFAVSALSASFVVHDPDNKFRDLQNELQGRRLDCDQVRMNSKYSEFLKPRKRAEITRGGEPQNGPE